MYGRQKASDYGSYGYSQPPPADRGRAPNSKIRINYERVNPSSYGYNLPQEYKV